MKVTIQGIQFMGNIRHYMADGRAIPYNEIKGNPNIGDVLEHNGDQWLMIGAGEIDCNT